MDVRHSTRADLPDIERIYEYAREYMRNNGNPTQWGTSNPDMNLIYGDLAVGNSYVVTEGDRVVGTFAFIIGEDPTYNIIEEGQWLNEERYGTLHRVASDGSVPGVLACALAYCESHVGNVRVDTHKDNTTMQHLLGKYGYTVCGRIYTHDGTPRIAYHKVTEYVEPECAEKKYRVAMIGAGAIGGYFIWGLEGKLDVELTLIAEGERAQRMEKEGLRINGQEYRPTVQTPEAYIAGGAPDVVLVSTKYGALQDAIAILKKIVGPDTVVMSLLNGVDSEEIIGEAIGMEHMLYALMKISSARVGREVKFDPKPTLGLFFGEKGTAEPTAKTDLIEAILGGTPVKYTRVNDIVAEQWQKFALNCCGNLPQAALGVGTGAYADSEHAFYLSEMMWEEVRNVAAAQGITISPYMYHGKQEKWAFYPKTTAWSTLQDLRAKRTTEIEMFGGTMIRLGKELGVPVPYSTAIYHMIKALEEKNAGKFDYE